MGAIQAQGSQGLHALVLASCSGLPVITWWKNRQCNTHNKGLQSNLCRPEAIGLVETWMTKSWETLRVSCLCLYSADLRNPFACCYCFWCFFFSSGLLWTSLLLSWGRFFSSLKTWTVSLCRSTTSASCSMNLPTTNKNPTPWTPHQKIGHKAHNYKMCRCL